jgi:hypothetical protein
MTVMTENKPIQQPARKPYTEPRLTRHGDMRALTRSGTGSAREPVNQGQGSPQKRP